MLKYIAIVLLTGMTLSLPSLAGNTALPKRAEGDYLFSLIKKPGYKQAWQAMLAGSNAPTWIKQASGPSSPSTQLAYQGHHYELANSCKQHDCGNNRVLVLFDVAKRQAWGVWAKLPDDTPVARSVEPELTWYGKPDDTIRQLLTTELDRELKN
ncbi:Ivy family c-type lysozyme inhibitor [Chitinivorax sp. B]|uniref:Ivy family c-type lysozyme inhibitor n=1 Tax=Chitinivorax sp. B TaxID=2502235 RepID=UPI0010F518BD|nr:Ivy family c-type lysozyme inhibitor [Chitinivorax sp. B]